jgi:hypothetical protein
MPPRVPVALAALLLCSGVAPSPQPSPVLPEIGRTRANTPACAAMRDLVIPSFAAAQRADARFTETRKTLPSYADVRADRDEGTKYGVNREAGLARLGSDAARLEQEAQSIKKALDDPRLAKTSTDPQVVAERQQLEQLYAVQRARADALNEFVLREQVAIAPHTIGSNRGIAPRTKFEPVEPPPPIAVPGSTAPPGMPLLTGIDQQEDKRRIDEWTNGIALLVRKSEAEAAMTFLPIAQSCR